MASVNLSTISTQGCQYGYHSNEKPAPQAKPAAKPLREEIVIQGPPPKSALPSERPPVDEEMKTIKPIISPSHQRAMEQLLASKKSAALATGNFFSYGGK